MLGLMGDDQSNNVFVSCYKNNFDFYLMIWHTENISFVTVNNLDTNEHLMEYIALAKSDLPQIYVTTLYANKEVKIEGIAAVREYYFVNSL
jgi:hypothetical protein